MKRYALTFALFLTAVATLYGNPVFIWVPAKAYDVQALIVLGSLLIESLVITLLAKRKRWIRDSLLWLLVTLGTFFVLVFAPLRFLEWNPSTFADLHNGTVIWLEMMIVLLESLILWLLWLRKAGRSISSSLLIAVVGNSVSYAISLACFYYAFIPRRA